MALSEHEKRVLEEMERALYAEDPRFASTIRNSSLDRPQGRRAPLMSVLAVVGLAGLIAGVALPQPLVGVLGFLALLFGLYGVVEAALGNSRARRSAGTAKPKRERKSWTERAGERFDRRRDEME